MSPLKSMALTGTALVFAASSPAFASAVPLIVTCQVNSNNPVTMSGGTLDINAQGDIHAVGGFTSNANTWSMDWDITANPDPFVFSSIGLTNTTGITNTYVITVTLPISPVLDAPVTYGGSIGVTLTDSNGTGAANVAAAAGSSLYNGIIDTTSALVLLPAPTALDYSGPQFGSATLGPISAGLPALLNFAGGVATSITVEHRFTLTAGDSIGLTAVFNVVPEPSSALALVSIGGLFLRRNRSR